MTASNAAAWLGERDGFLIVTHKKPDGDTLGSAFALAVGLRRAGKTAFLLPNSEVTERYAVYLEGAFAPADFVPEHIVAVDTASEGMFARGYGEKLAGKTELCIDHHPSNEMYAGMTLLDASCAACGEIIYDVLLALNGSISEKEAELLYIAVSTDTGCFAYANVTDRTFACASEFYKAGAHVHEINKALFRTKTKRRIDLETHIFANMEYYCNSKIAVVMLPLKLLGEFGIGENELDDIAALPGIIEGVEASMVIRELPDGKSKVSMRSGETVNSSEICKKFGGGGHYMASGCTVGMTLEEIRDAIVAETEKVLK